MPPWLCLVRGQGLPLNCVAQRTLIQTKARKVWRLKTEQRAMKQTVETTPQQRRHGELPQAAIASSAPSVQL